MFLPQSKLKQVSWFETRAFTKKGMYDVIILHFKQWWRPRKKLMFQTLDTVDNCGRAVTAHSTDYLELVNQLNKYALYGAEDAMKDCRLHWKKHCSTME